MECKKISKDVVFDEKQSEAVAKLMDKAIASGKKEARAKVDKIIKMIEAIDYTGHSCREVKKDILRILNQNLKNIN